jgi:Cdc6-like AAA superfamily ATPase
MSAPRSSGWPAPSRTATPQQWRRRSISCARPSNLPAPLTRLIGRKQDIAAVRNALLRGEVRLLTLVGPPGIGKTSLSLAVARDVQAAFNGGASVVALAPLAETTLVLPTIAQTLGVTESADQPLLETLKAALHGKRLLLVLDNFEHLLAAAPLSGCRRSDRRVAFDQDGNDDDARRRKH